MARCWSWFVRNWKALRRVDRSCSFCRQKEGTIHGSLCDKRAAALGQLYSCKGVCLGSMIGHMIPAERIQLVRATECKDVDGLALQDLEHMATLYR